MKKCLSYCCIASLFLLMIVGTGCNGSQQIKTNGEAASLDIRPAGANSVRITLRPLSYTDSLPYTPALTENAPPASISLREISEAVKQKVGNLDVEVQPSPLSVTVTNAKGEVIQKVTFQDDGKLAFQVDKSPILGMGEGGPRPGKDVNWRELPVEFDRRGRMHKMAPRWQSDAYGSRNPVALLVGTKGWGLFVATPWVQVDLEKKDEGYFIPLEIPKDSAGPQTEKNQHQNLGKGIHPVKDMVPGLYDLIVFDAHNPAEFLQDFSKLTGPAAMPPKWALGYMQSHRTLKDDAQMMGVINSFRAKKIPLDAVIYLGTGFTPSGWNKEQPSFEFNPEVFKHDPQKVIDEMHSKHVKVVLHMVPWDRDKLPTLQGNIPPKEGEPMDASHIKNYWLQHEGLVKMGVDAFWPDEGDWFNLFERIKRHQLYYQGALLTNPNLRPWSLQRNGYPGIAQWGGWVWSGDTQSSWKTLEAQVAVGINYSLSIGPYWGSDIGGFYPNSEKTGELYTRWYQFGAFCGSFRSHGRTWYTSLPWGFGLSDMGVRENNNRNTPVPEDHPRNILQSEMNNPLVEPINKKYTELHYQLLPYTYTLAWEARETGMPLMRAMWLHYPDDEKVKGMGSQYLWGRDMLIAPVFEKGATQRELYLPKGDWYDWWTNEKKSGGQNVTKPVDLATMPIYVRAGAIIPFDPVRQYTAQEVSAPTTLRIYTGADGQFTLYDDDGTSQEYLSGKGSWIKMNWNDQSRTLTLEPGAPAGKENVVKQRSFNVQLVAEGVSKIINYDGKSVIITF